MTPAVWAKICTANVHVLHLFCLFFSDFGDVSDFSEQICTAMRKPGPKHDKRLDLPRIRFGAHLGMDL